MFQKSFNQISRYLSRWGAKTKGIVLYLVLAIVLTGIAGFSLWASYLSHSYRLGPSIRTGEAIQIMSVVRNNSSESIEVLVQNVGEGETTLAKVYVNGYLVENATYSSKELPVGQTSKITLPATYLGVQPKVTIKVVALEGAFSEISKTFS
jgi:hypothetical protein